MTMRMNLKMDMKMRMTLNSNIKHEQMKMELDMYIGKCSLAGTFAGVFEKHVTEPMSAVELDCCAL